MAYNPKNVELSGAAGRALKDASDNRGWATNNDEIGEAELERAGFVYDGAVTGDGYTWLQARKR